MSRVPRTLVLATCALAMSAVFSAGSVAAASTRGVRVGSAALVPATENVLGALPGSTKLDVTVALEPRDPSALAAFASAVSTPGSSSYRDYITPAQFAQRFGPTSTQIAEVRSSLRAHGLDPGAVSANGLAIPVTATAGVLADAFSISFSRLQAPQGKIAFASTAAPLFDPSVAGLVQGVVGLDTLSVSQPLAIRPDDLGHSAPLSAPHVVTGGPQPCAAAIAAAPGQQAYTTDQIASAYRFPGLYGEGDEGAGQSVAVYELEPDSASDIAAYQACYGTAAPVSYIPVDGGAGTGAGSGEAALDIEDLIGLVPKANVLVYQGPNSNSGAPGAGPYDVYNAIISQDRAKVITTSWGQCEPMEGATDAAAENTLFEEAASQGQTIISAGGDDGSEDCYVSGQNLETAAAVDDPSSQPYVTGVGGTSLATVGPPPSETVWNNGGGLGALLGSAAGAGGGGVSSLWKMPTYQSSAPASSNVINANSSGAPCGASGGYCREVPDVSANADPYTGYLMYYDGAWTGIGGTSAAAPVWAAIATLANASPQCSGTSVGFANPALYRVAGSPQYASYFDDVTAGNNDFTGTNGGKFAAGPGYDMASGLGTPIASTLAVALCETVTVANPGTQTSTLGKKVTLRIAATDAGNATLTYRATGLPAGLSIGEATGVITGKPAQAGTSTVEVRATDAGGRTSITSFTWSIRYPTVLSTSTPLARCGVELRRTVTRQAGALRLTGSLARGSVAVADARGKLLAIELSDTTVAISAGKKVLGTVTAATGGLHALVRTADEIELASGDRHFRLFISYGSAGGTVVAVKDQVCSYVASRDQRLTTQSGHAARGTLHLVSTNGASVAGASITITDGSHSFGVRTGRSGTASFSLAKGKSRSIRAVYAGGSEFMPASLTFQG
jgi:subtilase family serine protease